APDEGAALKAFQGLSQAPKAAPAAPSLAGAANSILGAAKDVGRSFESGADIGGVAGLVGLPNAAMHFVDRTALAPAAQAIVRATGRVPASDMPGGDKRPTIADGFPSPEAVTRSMEQVTGPAYKPQTTVGEVAHTLGEFAPNALAGGAGAALRAGETAAQTAARVAAKRSDLLGKGTVTQVVAPALASEGAGRAAREVSPDMEAPARLVGALAGGVGAAVAQAPRGASAVREGLEGFSAEQLAAAQALRAEARALPGGGIELPLDEALNQVTGGQASRLSQLARVVANSGGEGQRIASEVYSARPGQIEAAGRAAFDGLAEKSTSPTALGGAVQDAARAGLAETPQGMALTEARVAAGPRVTPEQAGQIIQPELRRAYDRREGMRAALAEPEYDAARQAPETVGIERTIEVERPGEPIVTQPVYSRPRFDDGAPRPAEPFTPPAAEATGPAGKSLARFIAENGGLRLDGDAAATDLHRYVVPGVGKVARPDGKGLDNFWRERLIEEGYFRPDADGGMARDIGPELLRKLQNEQRGFPSYPL
ncbi:MAG: hypothetical protein K2X24_12730, partial [Methylobacterium sp.]|nr:hypothetical protein [Methylobacterium sp.]